MMWTEGSVALVVEDHDFQRRVVVRMLQSLGAGAVLEANDGNKALALIESGQPIDLILCDLDMAEMDGMELIRHMGRLDSPASVIIVSGHERSLLEAAGKMVQAYGVKLLGLVEKPVTLKILAELIGKQQEPADISASIPGFSIDEILGGMRRDEFEPFFQPKVDLATGQTIGVEALARWNHPEHGVVGPSAFITALEQGGHIDELTLLMLEKASIACQAWRLHESGLTVSVNLSLVSLNDSSQADRITSIVTATGLDPHHMVLEVTETVAMKNIATSLENFVRLRMRGFGLSIDDYGTGFASLQQLRLAPFTELKIDRSFVTGAATDPSLRAIIESSVQMARRLGIKSVGEGVETQADWDVLKAVGCDMAQGYFVAKPMTGRHLLRFLERSGVPSVAKGL
jgi:EAL domain-containing protein (putative c-di-GMP-specific phosphodiesterase class I)/ActR/RegA family two-component response regulator